MELARHHDEGPLNADISARYQSAGELLRDLEEFSESPRRRCRGVHCGGESLAMRRRQAAARCLSVPPVNSAVRVYPTPQAFEKSQYALRIFRCAAFHCRSHDIPVELLAEGFFSPAERIEVPDFVGSDYESVINSELRKYSTLRLLCH
jgi:hypothetical protein